MIRQFCDVAEIQKRILIAAETKNAKTASSATDLYQFKAPCDNERGFLVMGISEKLIQETVLTVYGVIRVYSADLPDLTEDEASQAVYLARQVVKHAVLKSLSDSSELSMD